MLNKTINRQLIWESIQHVHMWAVDANSALLKYFERNICFNIHINWRLETPGHTWDELPKTDLRLSDPDLQQKHGASEQKRQSCQLSESFQHVDVHVYVNAQYRLATANRYTDTPLLHEQTYINTYADLHRWRWGK